MAIVHGAVAHKSLSHGLSWILRSWNVVVVDAVGIHRTLGNVDEALVEAFLLRAGLYASHDLSPELVVPRDGSRAWKGYLHQLAAFVDTPLNSRQHILVAEHASPSVNRLGGSVAAAPPDKDSTQMALLHKQFN
ncbi:hypothetical protein [Streptomyces sp. NPDC051098]|uniref:hypothetical protein n=1 Tax=Streptomyces sp. NPDC051098 TaxID=3155411 RepID=UPI003422606A